MNRTGVQWDLLPHDFPPGKTVFDYYTKWRKDGTDQTIHDLLRAKARRLAGKEAEPTAAMVDSQSAKSAFSADAVTVGIDGNKKVRGRKRNIVGSSRLSGVGRSGGGAGVTVRVQPGRVWP